MIDIPHACGRVLDVVKISDTKSQLVCVVCRKERGVWIPPNKNQTYPEKAQFLIHPEKYI